MALAPLDGVLDRLPETRRPRLWLSLLCLLMWAPSLFSLPAGDRDESRFAQASRQMVESGDYVRIRNGEVERNKKPVGIHWAQAGIVHTLEAAGLPARGWIGSYRLASLIGAWLAVIALFSLGRALVGRRAAFLAAAMLAATLLLVVETHIAKTDAALLASVVVAMGLMGRAYLAPSTFSARAALGFWLALGAGVLLKGPIAPMVPLLTGLTLYVADRGWQAGAPWVRVLRLWWGIPLMLACALPWLAAIGIATEGRFFAEAVGGDMLGKVGSGEESHWGPPGYYVLTFGIAAFPAAFLVLRGLPGAWAARMRPGTRFLLAWAAPTWLLFEAVATKLPHYVLPAWPALFLLGAAWACDPLRKPTPRWLGWIGWAALFGTGIGLAAAAVALPVVADGRVSLVSLLAVPVVGVMLWAVVRAARVGEWARAGLSAALLAVPLYWVVMGGVLPHLTAPWVSPRVAELVAGEGVPAERFGIAGYHEPSVVFAVGTQTRLLTDGAEAARFLAGGADRLVAVEGRQVARFEEEAASLGLRPRVVGRVDGFNYVRGRRVAVILFRAS
ncbi:glycosyltransferase family 39 protein [Roseomonas xinghualingensis]|uniref:glycosyltransferase family 39 protein n=1 Tax=Roseomonas xinghualingensis TaxID=2986475 RepID=UPI0021F0DD26|nr:glycosyltransferase family 39 protein [Roseomonas sp. SXEYE001]MCV4206078.1 glycosyltransferase family 39 protein [Roseomonas sp. SXEYE001]